MIEFEDLAPGDGPEVKDGNTVEVDYVGSFPDGKTFDKGRFSFKVGAGQVIQGFDMMVTAQSGILPFRRSRPTQFRRRVANAHGGLGLLDRGASSIGEGNSRDRVMMRCS